MLQLKALPFSGQQMVRTCWLLQNAVAESILSLSLKQQQLDKLSLGLESQLNLMVAKYKFI